MDDHTQQQTEEIRETSPDTMRELVAAIRARTSEGRSLLRELKTDIEIQKIRDHIARMA